MKEAAYKGMVRPILEYGSSVWDPHPDNLQKELEKVQNRTARFVTRNYDYETGSMTGIICTKVNRTLGFLRRTILSCPQNVKEAAYKGMVRPILEYGSSVWDPHTGKLQEELEKVQNCAARFVTRYYVYETGSMTDILGN